jgi:hypothetical protein
MRFTIGSGNNRSVFYRAPQHTAKWDDQKQGFRMALGLPAHGNLSPRS